MTYLHEIISPERFKDAVSRGLITSRTHSENPLFRIFSYTKRVQFDGLWTPETRLARGLILKFETSDDFETARVIGRGIPKFFTVEQAGDDWSATKLIDDDENVTVDEHPVIPWDAPAHIANKLNGALGLGYIAPDGGISVSTKGSFDSIEAGIATPIMRDKLSKIGHRAEEVKNWILGGYTPLFEIITPERPHPVNYGDLEDIIYLGFVDNLTGELYPADDTHLLYIVGFDRAETLPYPTLRKAVEAPYRENTEGMVATIMEDGVQHLFKVKPHEYIELRKMFYASQPQQMSKKEIHKIILSLTGEQIANISNREEIPLGTAGEMLEKNYPELADLHKKEIFDKILEVREIVKEIHEQFNELLTSIPDSTRKPVILAIMKSDYSPERRKDLIEALNDRLGVAPNYEVTYKLYRRVMTQLVGKRKK